jgi:CheY-like chemotaxis protein
MANKRALIVDDSTTAQYRLKKMLKVYALDIDVVDSGEAALRYLARNAPDVVFMDHSMPGMDGLRALQVIKSHPETAVIPVIMYTSQSGDVYTGQARALGALDVVSKDTINATDLSKVMEAIHIYPVEDQTKSNVATQDRKVDVSNKVADLDAHRIERRSPAAVAAEQTRNIELRLSHLERTIEDNRKFITARVLRELQGLRQSLRQEFTTMVQNSKASSSTTQEIKTEKADNTPTLLKFSVIFILLIIAIFLIVISFQLSNTSEKQATLEAQVEQLTSKEATGQETPSTDGRSRYIAKNDYLTDLTWAFNQHASLEFLENSLDPKPLIRLRELLNRISTTGFKGSVLVTISVGNFCNTIDNLGVAHVAQPETNINDCVFSSELYGIERLAREYKQQANLLLGNLIQSKKEFLNIMIDAQEGIQLYPQKSSSLTAGEWNLVAQKNNHIELALLPDSD